MNLKDKDFDIKELEYKIIPDYIDNTYNALGVYYSIIAEDHLNNLNIKSGKLIHNKGGIRYRVKYNVYSKSLDYFICLLKDNLFYVEYLNDITNFKSTIKNLRSDTHIDNILIALKSFLNDIDSISCCLNDDNK